MSHYHIGIDTGGTYTDAVIVDTQTHKILATNKAFTTRGKLDIGVINALEAVLQSTHAVRPEQITLVSLSTTLATNALVEGVGAKVAVVLIGFSDDMLMRSQLAVAIPDVQLIRVAGGHQYHGNEICPLDEPKLRAEIEKTRASVEAVAIAATYSVRNPLHEQRARDIIAEYCDHPVTISSELSDGLNGPLRALTATFNVRIVPLIINLVRSVKRAMQLCKITAPLMIVKGDGSMASAESVIGRPIETILSGPAASIIGARFTTRLNNFVIVDVGGTTSDVASVSNGWPSINEKGAMAGQYRTLVRAIDMQTVGLGGDSEVEADDQGGIVLKNNRVVPISLLCHRFPELISCLQTSLGENMGLARALKFVFLPEGLETTQAPPGLSVADLNLLRRLDQQPQAFDTIVLRPSDRGRVERLISRGLIQVSGLTPSDAAHALHLQSQWSTEAARLACLMFGRAAALIDWQSQTPDADTDQCAKWVFTAMVQKSTYLVMNQLSGRRLTAEDALVLAITRNQGELGELKLSSTVGIPVVAVGGPAAVFYPEVGKLLHTEVLIPEHADVANAIGAAIGQMRIRKVIEITRAESGGYQIHHPGAPIFSTDATQALLQASTLARDAVKDRARIVGAQATQIDVQIERVDLPNMDSNQSLISALVIAEYLGTPESASLQKW